jgi:tRNA(fMet)-specific endonuclease VapC
LTLIDTSTMVAFLNGTQDVVRKIEELINQGDTITVATITIYELLKGAQLSSRQKENLLLVTEAISSVQILDLSNDACLEAARIYCTLNEEGKLIGEFDILIAAIAKTNGEAILTRDQHFKAVPGLILTKW